MQHLGHVLWSRLDDGAFEPTKAHAEDAGWDLACLEDTWVPAQGYVDVRTGLATAMPVGYYMRLVGRSSTFRKRGLMVIEGIIDAGFRGELFACVYNPGYDAAFVRRGEKLVQAIISQYYQGSLYRVSELPESERGEAGFGSSGL